MDNELSLLKKILIEKEYPSVLIEKNIKPGPPKVQITSVERKTLYVNINFRGDRVTDVLERRMSDSLKRTFFAATL